MSPPPLIRHPPSFTPNDNRSFGSRAAFSSTGSSGSCSNASSRIARRNRVHRPDLRERQHLRVPPTRGPSPVRSSDRPTPHPARTPRTATGTGRGPWRASRPDRHAPATDPIARPTTRPASSSRPHRSHPPAIAAATTATRRAITTFAAPANDATSDATSTTTGGCWVEGGGRGHTDIVHVFDQFGNAGAIPNADQRAAPIAEGDGDAARGSDPRAVSRAAPTGATGRHPPPAARRTAGRVVSFRPAPRGGGLARSGRDVGLLVRSRSMGGAGAPSVRHGA